MTAEIIDFTTTRDRPRAIRTGRMELPTADLLIIDEAPRKPDRTPQTTTAKNARLRSARWEVWRRADAVTDYWDALLNFHGAVLRAKRHGLKEARAYDEISEEGRWSILESYREALNKHLLTPAPDVASVNWKRHKMREYGVKKELVEKAIADDIAFLNAHPARNPRANKLG